MNAQYLGRVLAAERRLHRSQSILRAKLSLTKHLNDPDAIEDCHALLERLYIAGTRAPPRKDPLL
jgi:hypothetical protein